MKKSVLFLLAAVITLSGCNKDESNEREEQRQNVISFHSTVIEDLSKATRVATTTSSVMNTDGHEMDVLGCFQDDEAEGVKGIQYVGRNNGTITLEYNSGWDYQTASDISFWPGTADIYFQAVYPSTATGVTENPTTAANSVPRLNRTVTIQADAANQVDLMFGDGLAHTGRVDLNFLHALSKIEFKAQMLNNKMAARIKGIKVHNVYATANVGFLGTVTSSRRALGVSSYVTPAAANSFTVGMADDNGIAVTAYESPDNPVTSLNATDGALMMLPQTATLLAAESKSLLPAYTTSGSSAVTKSYADNASHLQSYIEMDAYIAASDGTALLGSYDSTEDEYTYGKVYIPFQADWEIGTSYVYTFQIGEGSGGYDTDGEPVFLPITLSGYTLNEWSNGDSYDISPKEVVDLSYYDTAGQRKANRSTANCYMIHKAGTYKIPLVYGNAIKNGVTNTNAFVSDEDDSDTCLKYFVNHAGQAITDPWINNNSNGTTTISVDSAQLLWQDAAGLINEVSISGDYLVFNVPSDASSSHAGNAIVAVYDNDVIVWSWHFWITTETYENTTTVTDNTYTYYVAPSNVGWVSSTESGTTYGYCTFYQWGRKDAEPPSSGSGNLTHTLYDVDGNTISSGAFPYITHSSTSVSIATTIRNPTVHYYNSSNGGPYSTNQYNLWDANENNITNDGNYGGNTVKTIYDPCPPGFCVPRGNLYYRILGITSAWDADISSRYWETFPTIYFPASGYRFYSSGTSIYYVGSNGYCWSSSVKTGIGALHLGVYGSGAYVSSYVRTGGFAVRPVLEN